MTEEIYRKQCPKCRKTLLFEEPQEYSDHLFWCDEEHNNNFY